MWFIIGMMVGAGMADGGSGGGPKPNPMVEIPFRCFVALDDGDEAYRACRRLSMTFLLTQQVQNTNDDATGYRRGSMRASVDEAMSLELRALRAMEKAAREKSAQR